MPQEDLTIETTIIIVSTIILLLVLFIGFVLVLFYYRRKKSMQREIELHKQFSQTLRQSQLEIKEHTLQHISHELHDNLGQIASLIKINLTTLQLHDKVKAAEGIEDTKELTRRLISDIKSLSVSLGSDGIIRGGLAKAIATEIERLNKTGLFTASFHQCNNFPLIHNDVAIILYRMVQEVLNNMLKHSNARNINVLSKIEENLFILALTDDGVGFDVEQKANSDGAGLFNLQNRAKLIHAQLIIRSIIGNGTQVIIKLPL